MSLILIVEGPDGSGKTTLVNTLHSILGWPVSPRVVSKDTEAMVDLDEWLERDLGLGARKLIYDRHRLISEPVYGPIVRGRLAGKLSRPTWLGQQWVKFRHIDPLIVMCLPPLEVVLANLKDDPDNTVILPHAVPVYLLYYLQMVQLKASGMSVFWWNYTHDGPGDPFADLTNCIDWWSRNWPLTSM